MAIRQTCIIALVVVLGLSALGGQFTEAKRSAAAEANAEQTGADIAKREAALAKEALELISEMEMNGQVIPGSHEVGIWSRRLVEATRTSGATKPEVIEAMKQHLARMEQRAAKLKGLNQTGNATRVDVLNAQYEVLEARRWLEEEQGK